MFKDIREISSLLDDTIEKSIEVENQEIAKARAKRMEIRKALSFDPMSPVELGPDSTIYNPYRMLPDGSYAPYSAQHWADQAKYDLTASGVQYHRMARNPDGYRESEAMLSVMKAVIDDTIVKAVSGGGGSRAGSVPVGTVHEYHGQPYRKEGPGDWRPVQQGGARKHPVEADYLGKRQAIEKELAARKNGKQVSPVAERTKQANEKLAAVTQREQDLSTKEAEISQREVEHRQRELDARDAEIKKREDAQKFFEPDGSLSLEGIKKHMSTDEAFKKGGEYDEKRKPVHEKILDEFSSGVKSSSKPIAFLSGGGSGSGKSSVVELLKGQFGDELVHVDSDEIKQKLPEYQKMKSAKDERAASFTHAESSDLAMELIARSLKAKKPILYDGTMSSLPRYEKLIKDLKDHGYEVHVGFADVPLDVAKQRCHERFLQTGRKVPDSIIEESHAGAHHVLSKIAGMVDSATVYDTHGRPPKIKKQVKGVEKSFADYFMKAEKKKPLIDRMFESLETLEPDYMSKDSDFERLPDDKGEPIKYSAAEKKSEANSSDRANK